VAARRALKLRAELLGALPVINHFLGCLRVEDLLERHLRCDDARLKVSPATVLGVVIREPRDRAPAALRPEALGPGLRPRCPRDHPG
jgi:hypothetical protein